MANCYSFNHRKLTPNYMGAKFESLLRHVFLESCLLMTIHKRLACSSSTTEEKDTGNRTARCSLKLKHLDDAHSHEVLFYVYASDGAIIIADSHFSVTKCQRYFYYCISLPRTDLDHL